MEPASWSRGCKEDDRTRPPPRGGWRGHGWDVHAWQKTSSRGRDGGSTAGSRRTKGDSTLATNVASLLRMHHAAACIDGRPQYSSRRPFHLLRSLNPGVFLPPGGTPLSEGGGCLRTLHSPNTAPQAHHHHSRPLKSPKNQKFPIAEKFRPFFPMIGKKFRRFSSDWKIFSTQSHRETEPKKAFPGIAGVPWRGWKAHSWRGAVRGWGAGAGRGRGGWCWWCRRGGWWWSSGRGAGSPRVGCSGR